MNIKSFYSNTKLFITNPSEFVENNPIASIIASIALKIFGASSSIACALLYVTLKETLIVDLTLSSIGLLSLISFIYSLILDYKLMSKTKENLQNEIDKTNKKARTELDKINKQIDEISKKSPIDVLDNLVNENPLQNGYEWGNFIGRYFKTSFARTKGFFFGLYHGIFY
jgi:hypothetical protein